MLVCSIGHFASAFGLGALVGMVGGGWVTYRLARWAKKFSRG